MRFKLYSIWHIIYSFLDFSITFSYYCCVGLKYKIIRFWHIDICICKTNRIYTQYTCPWRLSRMLIISRILDDKEEALPQHKNPYGLRKRSSQNISPLLKFATSFEPLGYMSPDMVLSFLGGPTPLIMIDYSTRVIVIFTCRASVTTEVGFAYIIVLDRIGKYLFIILKRESVSGFKLMHLLIALRTASPDRPSASQSLSDIIMQC